MKWCLLALAAVCLSPLQEPKESKSPETARFRDLPEIVGQIANEVESNDRALVVWLVDNAAMLKTFKQADLLAESIRKSFKKPRVSHVVISFAARIEVVQSATEDLGRVATALQAIANAPPDNSIKDCLAAVREAAKATWSPSAGKKYVVLFTQENGDNEDDVEETLKLLKMLGIVFLPIVPEAVYSDPYWESALTGTTYFFNLEKIKKLKLPLKGPESAYLEFPYGWPFTWVDPAYTVPSGFAPYALDRLATYTGGKAYLHFADPAPLSFCRRYGCRFCAGQHRSCGASFDEMKLKMTAPDIGSRPEHLARYGKDRANTAIVNAWDRLFHEGILRGAPPLKSTGGGLAENPRPIKPSPPSHGPLDFKATRQDAIRAEQVLDKLAAELAESVKKLEKDASPRMRATFDALQVHVRLLAQAYRQQAAFCEEMDRIVHGVKPGSDGVAASALESPGGERLLGYMYQNVFLCHGGAPLKEVKFLGDLKGLHAALDFADEMIEKHRGTPWEVLIRRASVPVFVPYYDVARSAPQDRTRPRSDGTAATTETPGSRPTRPTQGDSGPASGTATGGNR